MGAFEVVEQPGGSVGFVAPETDFGLAVLDSAVALEVVGAQLLADEDVADGLFFGVDAEGNADHDDGEGGEGVDAFLDGEEGGVGAAGAHFALGVKDAGTVEAAEVEVDAIANGQQLRFAPGGLGKRLQDSAAFDGGDGDNEDIGLGGHGL